MRSNKKRTSKIFNRWLKENQLYFKYMNETRQECIYLKKNTIQYCKVYYAEIE